VKAGSLMLSRTLLVIALLLGVTAAVHAAKPPALLSPVVSLGPITNVQRQIIFNHLQAELSERFELISQRRYEEAQQKAFEELEFEECTEENCIRYVQDTLQVEVHFSLQLLQDEKITQLTLAMVNLDRKVVKAEVCEECSTLDLNESISDLVEEMYDEIDFDRLALPYDTRLDPAEKFPELASNVRITLQVSPAGFFLVPGSFFSSLENDKTKVEKPYKLTSIGPEIGIGIGRNYLIELRVRPSSGIDIPTTHTEQVGMRFS
jgi:hypothetical protein